LNFLSKMRINTKRFYDQIDMRDVGKLKGKCRVCGGCRARAYSGDYLAEEPYCVYEPQTKQR